MHIAKHVTRQSSVTTVDFLKFVKPFQKKLGGITVTVVKTSLTRFA